MNKPKNHASHAWQHSTLVCLLGRSICSYPSSKELHALPYTNGHAHVWQNFTFWPTSHLLWRHLRPAPLMFPLDFVHSKTDVGGSSLAPNLQRILKRGLMRGGGHWRRTLGKRVRTTKSENVPFWTFFARSREKAMNWIKYRFIEYTSRYSAYTSKYNTHTSRYNTHTSRYSVHMSRYSMHASR